MIMFCRVDEVFPFEVTNFFVNWAVLWEGADLEQVQIYHLTAVVVAVVGDTNPYQTEATSAEFFSCGFLQHTYIFVAESLVDEVSWLRPFFVYIHLFAIQLIANLLKYITQYCQ